MTPDGTRPDGRSGELVDLLSLLLPQGAPRSTLVLGSRFGVQDRGEPWNDRADLVLLIPSAAEQRDLGWLEGATAEAAERLTADGAVYVVASPTARRRVAGRMSRRGIAHWEPLLHHPGVRAGRHLLPLRPEPLRMLTRRLSKRAGWQRIGAALLGLPGAAALLKRLAPDAALLGRRGTAPLGPWAVRRAPAGETGTILVSGSWEGSAGTVIGRYFSPGAAEPTLVAKFAASDGAERRLSNEAAALRTVAGAAGTDRVRIPDLIEHEQGARGSFLVQSGLPGREARSELGHSPDTLEPLLRSVAGWLQAWHLRTLHDAPEGEAQLAELLLTPARRLAPCLESGTSYLRWLERACAEAAKQPVPLVAAHQDLTMSNVLCTSDGIGVVDWEAATPATLPFVDLPYAAVDAVLASRPGSGRADAWDLCYSHGARTAILVADLWSGAWAATPAVAPLPTLAFHACWLHHAANEVTRTANLDGPFLGILRRVAAAPDSWGEAS